MLQIFKRKSSLGIEITPGALRMAMVAGTGREKRLVTAQAELPAGVIAGSYTLPNICDPAQLTEAFRRCLHGLQGQPGRAALCLPDGIFRVQTLEFDELPGKTTDRERLIRWRLEKSAAFDLADTVLRYQVLARRDSRFTILSCIAKKTVIEQYEAMLREWGLEPWSIGLASFSTLNFYAPYMTGRSAVHALVHVTEEAFATIVSENGGVRFYRFKELKRVSSQEVRARLMREVEDSLHFYSHMDRTQQSEVGHLYLSGEPGLRDALAAELRGETSLNVELLTPDNVLGSSGSLARDLAAAAGAGTSL